MGDSWISPIDSVLTWGPYLHATVRLSRFKNIQIVHVSLHVISLAKTTITLHVQARSQVVNKFSRPKGAALNLFQWPMT